MAKLSNATHTMTDIEKKLLHATSLAARQYNMIPEGDTVLACLSGGKDSFTMLKLLSKMRIRSHYRFHIHAFTLDQGQPGWQDEGLKAWLQAHDIAHTILSQDTYSIVKEKIPEGKTYCALCSRLRRGIIYRFAKTHGYRTIALGHHRDDAIETLMMSILYNGHIKAMPPKLLTDDGHHMVIRPLIFCQEQDIIAYAKQQTFPIIPCNLCGAQVNLTRKKMKTWLRSMAQDNPNIMSNALHAMQSLHPSQMMDEKLWDFKALDDKWQPFDVKAEKGFEQA